MGDTVASPRIIELVPPDVLQVAIGSSHYVLLVDGGTAITAGDNVCGQLGNGNFGSHDYVPRGVSVPARVVQVAAGSVHSVILTHDHEVWTWGQNVQRQCGVPDRQRICRPTRCALGVAALRVAHIACGGFHTLVTTADGRVLVFGDNRCGQLGLGRHGDPQSTSVPLTSAALADVHITHCAGGVYFTLLLSDDGRVFAMGDNESGQLGLGPESQRVGMPTQVATAHFDGERVVGVAGGGNLSLFVTHRGNLFACGFLNRSDRGYLQNRMWIPTRCAVHHVVRAAATYQRACVLLNNGTVCELRQDGPTLAIDHAALEMCGEDDDARRTHSACALSTGCYAPYAKCIGGAPPWMPGNNAPISLAWQRRRVLLLCLVRARGKKTRTSSAMDRYLPPKETLLMVATLPAELWRPILRCL